MNDIITQFLDDQPKQPYNTYKSLQADCKSLNEYLILKDKELFKLANKSESDKYVKYLSDRFLPRTIKRRICTLRKILRWCKTHDLLPDKLKISVADKETMPERSFADKEDISLMYKSCSHIYESDDFITARAKTECMLIILCGFKTSELAELSLDDITENAFKYTDSANRSRLKLFKTDLVESVLSTYLKKRKLFMQENNIKSNLLFITAVGSVSTRIHADFNTIKELAGVSHQVTAASIRNSCLKYYYNEITDDVLIAKLFNVSERWVRLLEQIEC